ncbi:hypothetical protein BCT86_02865 [Vibrio breoganii]|uniref:Glycine transporter domain-containing protein n=1 Tax=Vibrio breoganii TaxID=553239 RepID=A0AAN0XTW2_9VIBR|nr:TRIC cation channel family protein [Vibrio breoganii]ANO32518.1 hypothetical protein A6E01_04625 [Vibrio breoganii]MDN3717697.1 TRIC cation channel family protein [Vibrio breoganii]PMG01589.1 hypothetical protein BCV02_13700 [Vibrio breoganii]PMG83582.1 hypothetical protein BCU81_01850 [Vibrio breoganii]PMG93006.1 hypothetical protein BCU80_00655 [Vibrio breoganii]
MYLSTSFLTETFTVLGTAAFALSAVLAANEKRTDVFSVVVLGVVTAVGGGTIRDCLLGVPVFWSEALFFIWIAIISSLIGFVCVPLLKRRFVNRLYLYIDAIAIAMFSIQGVEKAWDLGFGLPLGPIIMGVLTAIGGGVVRDMLLQRPTLFLNKELYAIPVALGCTFHVTVLALAPALSYISSVCAIGLVIYIRYLAINKSIEVPSWAVFK